MSQHASHQPRDLNALARLVGERIETIRDDTTCAQVLRFIDTELDGQPGLRLLAMRALGARLSEMGTALDAEVGRIVGALDTVRTRADGVALFDAIDQLRGRAPNIASALERVVGGVSRDLSARMAS